MPENYKAINPYNFIPFGDAPERKPLESYYEEPASLKSGWIDVRLDVKTPLIIPDGSRYKEENRHKTYKFFRLPDGQPAIPGSSLRGMIRSMYEAATNSCVPFLPVEPKRPISQRTPLYAAFKKRGLLEYDKDEEIWKLWNTKVHAIKSSKREVSSGTFQWNGKEYRNAERVTFKTDDDNCPYFNQNGRTGYFQFSIPVVATRDGQPLPYYVAILEKAGDEPKYTWPKGDNSAYKSLHGSLYDTCGNIKKANDKIKKDNKKARAVGRRGKPEITSTQPDLYRALEAAKEDGGMVPVYYFCVDRDGQPLYYFSGASAGRVQQRRKWPEIMGRHSPCAELKMLCPACALFGTVADEGTKGRIRFTDAVCVGKSALEEHTLPILGGPRPSSFEFYLRKPETSDDDEVTYWNFDYYGTRTTVKLNDGTIKEKTEYHDLFEASPRGRKMYWHCAPQPDRNKNDQLNATMEAVTKGAFKFGVYFDRITDQQLQDLIWVITLGDNDQNSPMQFKLGHAKPLGYGSVKLTAEKYIIRSVTDDFSMKTDEIEIPKKPACSFNMSSEIMRSILRMCDKRTTEGKTVDYLYGADKNGRDQIYLWFAKNRTLNTIHTAPDALPEPTEADLALPTSRLKTDHHTSAGQVDRNRSDPIHARQPNYPRKPTDEDFTTVKVLYPVGKETKAEVSNVTKDGRRVFFRLQGTPCNASSQVFAEQSFESGQVFSVQVTGYFEPNKTVSVNVIKGLG